MVRHLKQSVTDFKQELPIIIALGNSCLKPRHWKVLQEIIGISVSLNINCKVENLLALKVNKNRLKKVPSIVEIPEGPILSRRVNVQEIGIRKARSL